MNQFDLGRSSRCEGYGREKESMVRGNLSKFQQHKLLTILGISKQFELGDGGVIYLNLDGRIDEDPVGYLGNGEAWNYNLDKEKFLNAHRLLKMFLN